MLKCEIRADDTLHIEGYVNAVERDSLPLIAPNIGKCVEQIRAGAFGAALLENQNIEILENHDRSRKLGSTAEGNLTLNEDNIGLRASADITDSEIISKAKTGQLKGWSFGFTTVDYEVEKRADNIPRRIVKALKLSEVSLVDGNFKPCYPGTLVEVRADGMTEFRSDEEIEITDNSEQVTAPDYSYYERCIRLRELEMRYNPYHDPSNGRFTSGGGGGGGYLYVAKGQKGKGTYVVDVDHDDEFEKWKKEKAVEKSNSPNSNIYNKYYGTPDEYKQALAEKYNGITDVSKIKTANDVADFINYDTQSKYWNSAQLIGGGKGVKSSWDTRNGQIKIYDPGFSSGTTAFELPQFAPSVFADSLSKVKKNGIRIGHWYDDTYMVTKKKGARVSKWLEGVQ